MNTKDLVIDDHTQGEKVEHICKIMPHVGVTILSCAFCVEAVGLRYAARFVVAPNQVYTMWVSELQAYK